MILAASLLAAGLVPPANGVRYVEPDVFAEIRRSVPVVPPKSEPAPSKLARLVGWVPAARVTPGMRRWADKVLSLGLPIGRTRHRRFTRSGWVLARVELHQHQGGPVHRGVSLYVRAGRMRR